MTDIEIRYLNMVIEYEGKCVLGRLRARLSGCSRCPFRKISELTETGCDNTNRSYRIMRAKEMLLMNKINKFLDD